MLAPWAKWGAVGRLSAAVLALKIEGAIIESAEEATAETAVVNLLRKEGPGLVSIPTRGGGAGMYGMGRMEVVPGAAQVAVIVPAKGLPVTPCVEVKV